MADSENKRDFLLKRNKLSLPKRKFKEIEKDKSESQNIFSPKFPKITDSSCPKEENRWELFRSIKPYTVKSYSSLLPLKSSIPNLMDGSESSHQINSNQSNPLSSLYSSSSVHSKLSSVFLSQKCINSETVEETCNIYSEQNLNNSLFDSNSKYAPKENKLINQCKKMTDATNYSSESISSSQLHHKKFLKPESLSFSESTSAVSSLKHIDQGKVNAAAVDEFTTAAGKSINVSSSAMLAAQRLIQSVFQDEAGKVNTKSTNANHELCVSHNTDSASFSMAEGKTSTLKYIDQGKVNATPIDEFTTAAGKGINVSSSAMLAAQKLIQSVFQDETRKVDTRSTNANHKLGVSYDTDSASFSMVTGKTIGFLEPAMKTTHKFIQDGFENKGQMMSLTSGSYNTRKEKRAFKDIGCPPKKLLIENSDDTMDEALLKNFFEDAAFDEDESQDITESGKDREFNKALEAKTNNDLTTRKIRKSLGGRRSMKFYK